MNRKMRRTRRAQAIPLDARPRLRHRLAALRAGLHAAWRALRA